MIYKSNFVLGLKRVSSPISKEIKHFVIIITVVALFFSVIFFIAALIMGYSVIESFLYFIAILVANVPEGKFEIKNFIIILFRKFLDCFQDFW